DSGSYTLRRRLEMRMGMAETVGSEQWAVSSKRPFFLLPTAHCSLLIVSPADRTPEPCPAACATARRFACKWSPVGASADHRSCSRWWAHGRGWGRPRLQGLRAW